MNPVRLGLLIAIVLSILGVGLSASLAQDATCPIIAEEALETADALCDGLGRHEACYGHVLVDAVTQPGYSLVHFEEPGDTADVTVLQSLNLSPYNAETGAWGVAQMRLQASLPSVGSEDVTLLIFGSVAIENAVEPPTAADVTVADKPFIRVYEEPSLNAETSFWLGRGETITARERLVDGSWLRIEDTEGKVGWIQATLVTSEDGVSQLNVVDPLQPFFRPMQAFYFESADDATTCAGLPPSGLLVQTPEGAAEITLLINEVNISLGSTVFLSNSPNQGMVISLLEGQAVVSTLFGEETLIPGTQVTVPMNGSTPAGAPNPPVAYGADLTPLLPTHLLPGEIQVAMPINPPSDDPVVVKPIPPFPPGTPDDIGEGNQIIEENGEVPISQPADNPNTRGPVTICHIPPGNQGNPQTLTVDAAALQGHLDHGDTLGACP